MTIFAFFGGVVVGSFFGIFTSCLIMAGRATMGKCIDCEYYRPFHGVYECWNRDSDNMYKPTLPDDGCGEFEEKERDNENDKSR